MNKFVGYLVLLALVRSVLYALIIPPWQAPDEPGHFEYVALIAQWGRIPASEEQNETLTLDINASAQAQRFESFHPNIDIGWLSSQSPPVLIGPREAGYQKPLYYLLLAPIYRLLQDQPVLIQYHALVLASGMMAAGTIYLAAQTARTLFADDQQLQIAIPLLVLFWPTQSFMAAAINNDNLATLLSAWCMLELTHLFRRGVRWSTAMALMGILLMAPYTKRSAYFLVPLVILAGLGYGIYRWASGRTGPRQHVAEIVLASGAGAAFFAALSILVWPSWALTVARAMEQVPNDVSYRTVSLLRMIADGSYRTPERLEFYGQSLQFAVQTLWAGFGWGTLLMPETTYRIVGLIAVAGSVGCAVTLGREFAGRGWLQPWQKMALLVFLLAIMLAGAQIILVMITSYPYGHLMPGRYLLTLVIPLSTFLALGLRQLCPRALRPWLVQALVAGLILFDVLSLSFMLIPYYYG